MGLGPDSRFEDTCSRLRVNKRFVAEFFACVEAPPTTARIIIVPIFVFFVCQELDRIARARGVSIKLGRLAKVVIRECICASSVVARHLSICRICVDVSPKLDVTFADRHLTLESLLQRLGERLLSRQRIRLYFYANRV